jgi:CHAT domain-containing protein/Tfp pilus assembly protein PilF
MSQRTLRESVGLRFRITKHSPSEFLLALIVIIGGGPAAADEQPAAPPLTAAQQQRLKERDRYTEEIKKLRAQGKPAEAMAACEQKLAIEREVLGDVHEDVAASLQQLAEMQEEREDFQAAQNALQEVLAIQMKRHAEQDWRVTDARRALADLERRRQLEPQQRVRLKEAARLNEQVYQLWLAGKYQEALPLARQAVEIREKILGQQHPDYALSLINLAAQYDGLGQFSQAEPLYRQAMEIRKKALGEAHPRYAVILRHLYESLGDYTRAEPLLRQDLESQKRTRGEAHPAYAVSLNNLAELYRQMGDYARAEPLYRQALEIDKKALGEGHHHYAIGLNNLALLYNAMGDYARAEPLARQATEIMKKAPGEAHPNYASSLQTLAWTIESLGDYARAESLYRQALEILRKARGEAHSSYATCLNNLGLLYVRMGHYTQAEPLLCQALEIRKKARGEAHPHYATSLHNLAWLYYTMGNYARVEPLLVQTLQIRKKTLSEEHPLYALSLTNLARLYHAQGDVTRAESLLQTTLDISRRNLDLAAATQSERQQLAMAHELRYILDIYLSLGSGIQATSAQVYQYVLLWKGAVFARQQRTLHGDHEPALVPLYEERQRTIHRLATLAFAVPGYKNLETWRKQLAELTDKKEHLERELSRQSASFRTQREQQRRTPAKIQAALPQDAALIDFLVYSHLRHSKQMHWEQHLAAFVVRAGRPIVQIDLGPLNEIKQPLYDWRAAVQHPGAQTDAAAPGAALRRWLWQPLEKYLDGVRTVLISPDGTLAQLPFAALPGSQPDRYLLEEYAIAVVSVPQLLPELLAERESALAGEPSLLLVGQVDYGALPGKAELVADARFAPRGTRDGLLKYWEPLPLSRAEVLAIKDSFERRYRKGAATWLRDEEPTESAVRQQAPKHRFLHFATHGFFAPAELQSALSSQPPQKRPAAFAASTIALAGALSTIFDRATVTALLVGAAPPGPGPDSDFFGRYGISGFHPGLLSGIVLAGANRPAQPDQDDGILTALEVTELDLSAVELAVLSACETGLGQTAGGEGVLGLQRAFQVAGAKSVIASLWRVDDDATRALMDRFYEYLWQKKLSKLEALRQAQLALLRQGRKRGPGELVPLDPTAKAQAKPLEARTPPLYWAAFVLSGDWR